MTSTRFSYPITPIADDKELHELHPDLKVHQGRLCVYKAIAGAQGRGYEDAIKQTAPLRNIFKVPYDDDVWPVVLAYLSDYRYLGKYDSRTDTEATISESASKGDVFFISMGANDNDQSGHAIYAQAKDDKTVEYKDNESSNTTDSINKKFTNHTFLVFKRNPVRLHGSAAYRLGALPKEMIATIAYARTMYKGHKLNSEDYSEFTENEMTEDYGNSKLPGLLQGLQGDWTPLKKASDEWIAAMPKTS